MPEYILPVDDRRAFNKLSPFVRGYIEAMFFTDTNYGDRDEGEGIAESATVADLAPEALADIVRDCERFQNVAADLLARAYEVDDYSEEQAGRDFWFTRNGHGVGFWDRKQLEDGLGDELSGLCGWEAKNGLAEVDVYTGDDGLIYHG